jgi:Ca2+-binding EF-hand superfamily protein
MEELSEEQIEEFHEAFSLFDFADEDQIDSKELGTVLRSLGIHTTDEEKTEYLEKFEQNGHIRFKDFLEIIVNKISDTTPEDELSEALKLFDVDKKGYIDIDEFKSEMGLYKDAISEFETEEIINFTKIDRLGQDIIKIDYAVEKYFDIVKNYL